MVARLSSRVFLGEELCRNREWLDITISCTITNMTASAYLRMFPWFLRPLLNEVLPICRKMRAEQYVPSPSSLTPCLLSFSMASAFPCGKGSLCC